jgi:dihydrofolate synthase/folylpolyglutamate synthase
MFALARQGIKYDLDRMRVLVGALGNPHRAYTTIHVAGSNGKGSTSAFLSAMLEAAGHRVGLYTSPHLVRFRERIRIDGLAAPEAALERLYEEVQPRIEPAGASFFEATTLLAFLHFARSGVGVAVIETGLGGRLDATNVIDPVGVAITSLALEHTHILGSTITEIAREKAGIIKGAVVVSGVTQPEARTVLREAAAAKGAELHVLERGRDWQIDGEELVWHSPPDRCRVGLRGRHQAENAAIAYGLALRLSETGALRLPADARGLGIANTVWPGRFDVRRARGRTFVFDVAHNPAGAQALAALLRETHPESRFPLIVGILGDKDAGPLIDALAPLADPLWATTPEQPERALPAEDLARACRERGFAAEPVATPAAAIEKALCATPASSPIVITGSLFTVGPAMAALGFDPSTERVGLGKRTETASVHG